MKQFSQVFVAGLLLVFVASPVLARKPVPMPSPGIEAGLPHAVIALTVAEASPNHMMRPLNEANTIVYSQQFGGGGVATGLLLGPLGVAANIKGIKNRTEKESAELQGKIAIDPKALLTQALADSGLTLVAADASASAVAIKPELEVVSLDGERLGFDVALVVDQRPAGKNWTGRYLYQLDAVHPRATVAQGLPSADLQELEREATAGMQELVRLYVTDGAGTLKGEGTVKFYSDFLSTRFKFKLEAQPLPSTDGRFLARTTNSVISLPQSQVRLDK